MDFQSLARRELQALCKKNKIPANMTNVAMADALEALQNVEGLEELLNSSKSQNSQSPEKPEIGSPEIPRTVCRTSTRRRPIKAAEEPESSQTLTRTRRGTRRITEEVNQEKSEAVQTPAAPSSRKRGPAASARQKTTNAEKSSVQRVYSTRRSTRLSEKLGRTPMEVEFSKVMTKDLDGVEEENKGSELQAISEDSSKITDDSEVISDQKSVQSDNDSKVETEEITEESAKPDNSDFIEVSDEAYDEENTGESSMIITDSEVVSDQKPVQNVHDSRAEVQENTEESAKPDNSDCLEVLEVKDDEALDEQQNTEAEMQKNSEVECEKMDELNDLLTESPKIPVHLNDESIVEKGIDVSSVTMSVIENLNEGIEMENEHQGMGSELGLGFSAPPQASIDDSSCDSERTEFSLTDFADEVLCENSISIDSEMNVTSEGEPEPDEDDDDDDDDQGDSEEFDMDLLKQEETNLGLDLTAPPQASSDDSSCDSEKAELSLSAWMHSIGSDSSVVVDQSEAQVELESANQEIMDFKDISLPCSDYDPKPETGEPNSKEKADEINKSVELITAEENTTSVDESLSFLDSFPTPVKLMSPHRLKPVPTAISGRTPLSPLAASPLLNQAALSTLSTPTRKSSTKNPSAVAQKKTHISDNKENLDNNSVRKTVIKPEPGKKKNSRDTAEDIKKLSLRQLRKMFKELQIKENANKNSEDTNDVKEVVKVRPALQTLPENCMAKVETGTEN